MQWDNSHNIIYLRVFKRCRLLTEALWNAMSTSAASASVSLSSRVQCDDGGRETVFLLSGHDQRIHLYKEVRKESDIIIITMISHVSALCNLKHPHLFLLKKETYKSNFFLSVLLRCFISLSWASRGNLTSRLPCNDQNKHFLTRFMSQDYKLCSLSPAYMGWGEWGEINSQR